MREQYLRFERHESGERERVRDGRRRSQLANALRLEKRIKHNVGDLGM